MNAFTKIISLIFLLTSFLYTSQEQNLSYYNQESQIEFSQESISLTHDNLNNKTTEPQIEEKNIVSNNIPEPIIEEIITEEIVKNEIIAEKEPTVIKEVKNPTYIIDEIISIESFLEKPTAEVFNNDYEKAEELYNAILNKSSIIGFYFSIDEFDRMNNFIKTFESVVLKDMLTIVRKNTVGTEIYLECNPEEIYNEILMFNDLREIVLNLGIDKNTEQIDAIKKINDWIIDNLSYQTQMRNPYSAFKTKIANCEGYARIFEKFCKIINIECTMESGDVKTNGEYGLHAWNKVKLEDEWYYIDVCWNDSYPRNRYLLSKTLWYDHTKNLDINAKSKIPIQSDNKITFNNIQNIHDIISQPLEEDFGVDYKVAMEIYNAILNKDPSIEIKITIEDTSGEILIYDRYANFAKEFKNKVLNDSMELIFNTISWRHEINTIIANLNTGKIAKNLDNILSNLYVLRNTISTIGLNENSTELEAVTKIVNWMSNNLNYKLYHSSDAIEVLETKYVDSRTYSELFYFLCKDLGINAGIIKGKHNINDNASTTYWNKVKIGNTWYYSDICFYFSEKYENYQEYEYFLSETLWPTHEIITLY